MNNLIRAMVDKKRWCFGIYLLLILAAVFGLFHVTVNYDLSKYLAKGSETKKGMELMEQEFGELSNITAMFHGLKEEEKEEIRSSLSEIPLVRTVTYVETDPLYEKDGYSRYQIAAAAGTYSEEAAQILAQIRSDYSGYDLYVSGPVVDNELLVSTLKTEIPVIAVIAVVVIFLILFLLCDSWTEPFLFMACIGTAVLFNMGSNALLSSVSFMTFSVSALLQIGLSMDYSIMLMNRYRQERIHTENAGEAMKQALKNALGAILGSSVTTIAGLLVLLFMSFRIGRDMGIVLAKGVFFSLLTIFTLLPGLIVSFDRLLCKTKKRTLKVPTGAVMNGVIKGRFAILPLVLLLMAGAVYLKGSLKIGYIKTFDNPDQEVIESVFGMDNQIVLLYDKKEDASSFVKWLESRNDVGYVQDYSNTIGRAYSCQELAEQMGIDEAQAELLYRLYLDDQDTGGSEPITAYGLLTYLCENVIDDPRYSSYLGKDQTASLKEAKAELEDAKSRIENGLSELAQGENELIAGQEELDSGREALEAGRQELNTQKELLLKNQQELDAQKAALLAGQTELSENRRLLEDGALELSGQQAALEANEAALAAGREELAAGQAQIDESLTELEQNQESLNGQRETLEEGQRQLDDTRQQLLDSGMAEEAVAQMLAEEQARLTEGFAQLSAAQAELDKGREQLFSAQAELDSQSQALTLGEQQLISGREQLSAAKARLDESLAQLNAAQAELDNGLAQLNAGQKLLDDGAAQIEAGEARLDDGFRQLKEGQAELDSGWEELEAGKAALLENEGYAMLYTATDADGLAALMGQDRADIEAMLKLKRMQEISPDRPQNTALTLEEFLTYLKEQVMTDKTYSAVIDDSKKAQIDAGERQLTDSKELLLGDNCNRMIVSLTLPSEGEETFRTVGAIKEQAEASFSSPVYLVGDSGMGYEMDQGFSSELNFVTLLTIISILLVVLATFRSLLSAVLLVAVIQGAIFLTTAIVCLQQVRVNYIALILVQCILMGAAIDYGILFVSNYREARRREERKQAVRSAMNASIRTILTSSLILIGCCLSIGLIMTQKIISQSCTIIAYGAFCSALLVVFLLPALVYTLDRWIIKKKAAS